MKLDPRIKSQSLIYTPSNSAEIVVGEKGYFADELSAFSDLSCCEYCVLVEYSPDFVPDRPYCGKRIGSHRPPDWSAFYIPESSLKPTEKKYRPYTLREFLDDFAVGSRVKFRAKGGPDLFLTLNGYGPKRYKGYTITYIYIGGARNTLRELFDGYERYEDATGSWVPFGVEVEE